jgi:hypothetical protein
MPKKRRKKFWHPTSLLTNHKKKTPKYKHKNTNPTPTKKPNTKTTNQKPTNPRTIKQKPSRPNQPNPPNTKAVSEERPNIV